MAAGDVYEVVDKYTVIGKQAQNVYFYEQREAFVPSVPTTAQALAEEWIETVLPAVAWCQSPDAVHTEVVVRNLFDDVDAFTAVSGAVGTGGGIADTATSFTAYGLTLKTDNAAVRAGAKRIGGVDETFMTDGVASGLIIGRLDLLATALSQPITGGLIISDDIMFPVVVQRIRTGTPGEYVYRLPESTGETVLGTIIDVLVSLIVTSQVSRK
jgi:hypothetical protein